MVPWQAMKCPIFVRRSIITHNASYPLLVGSGVIKSIAIVSHGRCGSSSQAEQANKARHLDPVLNPGDMVWLRRKHIWTTRPSNKLDHNQIGPYTILEKVGSRAYKLDLPATVRIHPVFHISLLEPTASTAPIPGHQQTPPPPVVIQEQQEWEVEKILDSRHHRNQIQYGVKLTGFHDPDRTRYPARNFENSPDLVRQFHEEYPEKPASQL